jgi:hypothetical protein
MMTPLIDEKTQKVLQAECYCANQKQEERTKIARRALGLVKNARHNLFKHYELPLLRDVVQEITVVLVCAF